MNRREFSQLATGTALASSFLKCNAQDLPATKQFRFSVMIWTMDAGLPVERCIEIAAEAGYDGVELVGEFKKWSAQDTHRIMAKMRSLGLVFDSIAGCKVTLADPAGSATLVAQIKEHIAVAKDLGSPQIILTSGRRMTNLSRKIQHMACIDNLRHISDLAANNDIEIVIEPIDLLEDKFAYLNSVSEGFEIVQAVGSKNIKVLYDFYHEQRGSGNLIEKLDGNIDWIGLVHIADVPSRHEPGTGEIDYRNIYRKLAALNYNRFIAMEYYPTGDPMTSLKRSRLVALQSTRSLPEPYRLRPAG